MINDTEKKALQSSWKLLVPIADTVGDLFYRRLFQLKPEYRKLFPEEMGPQKKKLVGMLAFIVKSTQWTDDQWQEDVAKDDDLFLVILALGRRHADLYSVPVESYPVVGEALLWTLNYGLGEAFTAEVRGAWEKIYRLISSIMLMGMKNRAPSN